LKSLYCDTITAYQISEFRPKMKNTKIRQIILILLPLAQPVYSQNNNYIQADSVMTIGIDLIKGLPNQNSQFVAVKRKAGEIRYLPYQLTGYGFRGGPEYVSRSIIVNGQPERVFLERISKGRINLYYYTEKGLKTYFLEKDSTVFAEIPDRYDFRAPILEHTSDFNWKASQVQLARYHRNSLKKLISMYNKGINRPLPFPRFGVAAGYSVMNLAVPVGLNVGEAPFLSFSPASSPQVGIFADLPVLVSDFSVNTGVYLSKHGFSANSVTSMADIDVVVNLISARLPVLLRYTVPTLTWRPFINAGGIGSWHLKYKREIYESTIRENSIIINEVESSSVSSRVRFGYSAGAGMQYNLNNRNAASLEVRYSQFPATLRESDMSFTEVLLSYSF
jgi:hypothetical protein